MERTLHVSPKMFARMKRATMTAEMDGADGALAAMKQANYTLGQQYKAFDDIKIVVDRDENPAFPDGTALLDPQD